MMGKVRAVALVSLITFLFCSVSGCTTDDGDDGGGIRVIVTIPPQSEMVEAVGGDLVKVTVMVPPGESPHTYAPVPSQMKDVARAKAYFKVGSGVEFELNHMDEVKGQNQEMKVFDCSVGITFIDLEEHDHDHGEEGSDPHIWLSPLNAKVIVENIYKGLVKVDKENEATYKKNRDAYLAKLDALHTELDDMFRAREGEMFLIYHPSWGYFAHEYRLDQVAIEEGGKEPGPSGIAAIVEQAKENNITVVFVDPSFDQTRARTIADEIGGKVSTLDQLAEGYIDNMHDAAGKLEEGLSKG
jgi:zinc transport system substrate-binding protein